MVEARKIRGHVVNIIGTGLSGLVGSRVMNLLTPEFRFENLSLETGVDITQKDVVMDKISSSDASWIFHFAAITDLDAAEKERSLGESGNTWRVNVEGTRNIVEAARKFKKRVLYLSTDFVFDGNSGPYTEESVPSPASWYATTKYEGEKLVSNLGDDGLIVRIAFPYGSKPGARPDFVQRIIDQLRAGETVVAVTDQLITPTHLDDIVGAIRVLVNNVASGIYHAVGSQALSPFEAAILIADTLHLDKSKIAPTTWAMYYKNRAPRPLRAVLQNLKIESLGVSMLPFREGIRLIV